ncbi:alanine dehydrogenase [Gemmatimonadota bacterium]
MDIGIPKEFNRHEHRVGLTPRAVSHLTENGHSVIVERSAGDAAFFEDGRYEAAGAQIVYHPEEVYKRADVVCKVGSILTENLDLLKKGSIICAFQHLAVYPKEKIERLMELKATVIGYEIVRDVEGRIPVKTPFSEMAGQMAVHLAAHYLQTEEGGRGILMGSVPGVPPPTVLVLGGGTVGRTAAGVAHQNGAHVVVLDIDMEQLREINNMFRGQVVTALSTRDNLRYFTQIADVMIGAVLVPGERPEKIVTEQMVMKMRSGSVIVDLAIDQGGCIETSRPTSIDDPTYNVHGVVHYCVPNLTSNMARTASRALADAALPYVSTIADLGLKTAVCEDPGIGAGTYLYQGKMVHEVTGEAFDIPASPIEDCLEGKARS